MKLGEVAQKLGCRLEGPPELEIHGVGGLSMPKLRRSRSSQIGGTFRC